MGSFWDSSDLYDQVSPLQELLDRPDGSYSLSDILNENELIQELRGYNTKLIAYLSCKEVLDTLLGYIVLPRGIKDVANNIPEAELEKVRLAHKAAEIISCEVNAIIDAVFQRDTTDAYPILDKLFSILDQPPPIDAIQCGFFHSIFNVLLSLRPADMLRWLQQSDGPAFFNKLLKHLDNRSVAEIIISVLQITDGGKQFSAVLSDMELILADRAGYRDNSEVDDDSFASLIDATLQPKAKVNGKYWWQDSTCIMKELFQSWGKHHTIARHQNVTDILLSIVKRALQINAIGVASVQLLTIEDPTGSFIELLLSESYLQLLFDIAIGQREFYSQSASEGSLKLICKLLEIRIRSDEDSENEEVYSEGDDAYKESFSRQAQRILKLSLDNLGLICETLQSRDERNNVAFVNGRTEEPLGVVRLRMIELISTLLLVKAPKVDNAVISCGALSLILDAFVAYENHSIMQMGVASMLEYLLEQGNESTKLWLLETTGGKLLQRLVDANEASNREVKREGGARKGYMGQLTRVANAVDILYRSNKSNAEEGDSSPETEKVIEIIEACKPWNDYVAGDLDKTNTANSEPLAGIGTEECLLDNMDTIRSMLGSQQAFSSTSDHDGDNGAEEDEYDDEDPDERCGTNNAGPEGYGEWDAFEAQNRTSHESKDGAAWNGFAAPPAMTASRGAPSFTSNDDEFWSDAAEDSKEKEPVAATSTTSKSGGGDSFWDDDEVPPPPPPNPPKRPTDDDEFWGGDSKGDAGWGASPSPMRPSARAANAKALDFNAFGESDDDDKVVIDHD